MSQVLVRPYPASKVILLAFDWPDGPSRKDFLGFAIQRTPGFHGEAASWLRNRLTFNGPAPDGRSVPSNLFPIQKFMWWDAQINDDDEGKTLTYSVTPVTGTKDASQLVIGDTGSIDVKVPPPVVNGIGTYFNRAVVSSQAFSREFLHGDPTAILQGTDRQAAYEWLANGLQTVIPEFLKQSPAVAGAIYHLTDDYWVLPAMEKLRSGSMVYFWKPNPDKKKNDTANRAAVRTLTKLKMHKRTAANIMHDKFLVRTRGGKPEALLMGSANFTTEGLTAQANLLHTFESPQLAALYAAREQLLEDDPSMPETKQHAGWSKQVKFGGASIRVFFPPEPRKTKGKTPVPGASLQAIIDAVNGAQHSVLFCVYTTPESDLLEAILSAGDKKKMMMGLVNAIPAPGPKDKPTSVKTTIYHRSREEQDVFPHAAFDKQGVPDGFLTEINVLRSGPAKKTKDGPDKVQSFPVYIHHKFIIIDGETADPTIYTGSANMSQNSMWNNDENLMEIRGSTRLAQIYMAEFFRLYEHYRARAVFGRKGAAAETPAPKGGGAQLTLVNDASWADDDYRRKSSSQYKSRISMVRKI